ncbi:phage tail length tape measure family protein [Sphingomonas sp. R1]|uniref:phage tail length tape measure family protein n=1 Tax=Sphingomonas sp. R1 TaxID=399176 RepID=UPI002225552F|nr:phage tail length tape measure family protein [Sphingomonas sp. R1]UYY77797.1 phage tail length tape measure family protein [Sphingomonas sp. R1]
MTTLANLTTYFAGESASFLSAIEKSRGGLRALVKELDPVSAATDRFNKQQALLENGLKRGALTAEQHATAMGRLRTRYDEQISSLTKLNGTTGAARAGMQQLSFQIGDVASSLAGGAPPMQVFGQQVFQVIGALQLMQKESKGLIGFLGGPWGAVITSAVVLLAPLTLKLFETADASKELKEATDDLGKALDDIGTFFDRNTGKIKENNAAMLQGAMLRRDLKIEEARKIQESARVTGRAALQSTLRDQNPVFAERGLGRGQVKDINFDVAKLFEKGPGGPGIDAGLRAIAGSKSPNAAFAKQILEQRSLFVQSGRQIEQLQAEMRSLKTGVLDPSLRTGAGKNSSAGGGREGSAKSEPAAKPMDTRSSDRELQKLYYERIRLEQQGNASASERISDEQRILAAQTTAAMFEIDAQKKSGEISKQRAERLRAETQENYRLQRNLINVRFDDQLSAERLQVLQDQLAASTRSLQLDGDLARTADERRRIQLKILDNEIEAERASLQESLAKKDLAETERNRLTARLEALDTEKSKRGALIDRQNAAPLAQYLDSIPRTAGEVNESLQNIAADGLAQLNDGLAQAAIGSKSLGDVFSNVTDQILSDILRIVIQQQLIKPIASLLGGGGGSGGGLFSAIGSLFGGGGGDWASGLGGGDALNLGSLGLPGFANGGSFMIGGKGGIDQNVLSINGIPRAMVSASELVSITPGSDRTAQRQPIIVQVVGEEGAAFVPRVAGISGQTSSAQVQAAQRRSVMRSRQRLY